MRKLLHSVLGAIALLLANHAIAQDNPCPTGELTRVRLSKLKPGTTMADFEAAVAAHVAWYKAHHFKIDQQIVPVLTFGPDRTPVVATDEVMTFATGDNVPREQQDADWAAFVARYRAISDLVLEKGVCMPKK